MYDVTDGIVVIVNLEGCASLCTKREFLEQAGAAVPGDTADVRDEAAIHLATIICERFPPGPIRRRKVQREETKTCEHLANKTREQEHRSES